MSNLQEVTEQSFEQEVIKSSNVTVVDFWAPWCGYCLKLGPVLDQIAQEIPNAKLVKVNADECSKLAQEYSISGLPCLLIFKNGEPQDRLVGAMPKSNIMNAIQKYL